MKLKILILHDARFTDCLLQRLRSGGPFVVDIRRSPEEITKISRLGSFDVLITSVTASGALSGQYLQAIRSSQPSVHIIGVAGESEMPGIFDAAASASVDLLICPYDEEKLAEAVFSFEKKFLEGGAGRAGTEPRAPERRLSFDNMIGQSAGMREIFSKIASVSDKDISVLIGGESGTGKELVAQAIHNHSHRKNGPFIKVNCAAIPDTLIESELFGHEKGSFTGAFDRKTGKFELADNGTLFLDEVGDMSLATQSKVLRIIQEREFERIGGNRPIRINVRIITATHRDLVHEVREKRFREDLFFRLNVVSILLPPLRDRRDDILPLCEFFVHKFCKKFGLPPKKIALDVINAFMNYEWPGNIRELQNMIESAVAIEEGGAITMRSLPYPIQRKGPQSYGRRKTDSGAHAAEEALSAPQPAPCPKAPPAVASGGSRVKEAIGVLVESGFGLDEIEKLMLCFALKKTSGRQLAAARLMGIGKGEIQYKMKKFGIVPAAFRKGAVEAPE